MKRFFLILALSLPFLFNCSGKSEEKKLAEFNDKAQELFDSFNSQYQKCVEDATLTMDRKHAVIDSLYTTVINGSLKELCLSTIKSNKNNSVGVAAFNVMIRNVEMNPQQMQELVNSLGPKAREDESVKQTSKMLDSILSTAEGTMFKDFEVDGVKFSDYIGRGKYVLVDFWASWCGPCKEEIPNIAKIYKTYAGKDFDVLSVAVWDNPENTKAAAAEHGVVWNQIINAQKIPTDLYGIQGIPQIMLFGPDGTILRRDLRGDAIEAAVKEALGR